MRQLAEWQAFYMLEPWGYEVENWRAGLLSSVVANFSMASKRHDWRPAEFMPSDPVEEQQKKDQALQAWLESMAGKRPEG